MHLLQLTLPTAAENVALDEALLHVCERGEFSGEILRLWEAPELAVVVGRSSRVEQEVELAACRRQRIPVIRRASGGAAIVAGPGCLMYAVILRYDQHPELRAIDQAHRLVLGRLQQALAPLVPGVVMAGTSDLAIDGYPPRKFSGNSLRCRTRCCLYHGTVLYDFPLEHIDTCLRQPPREPTYRDRRAHGQFLTNVPITGTQLRQRLIAVWQARADLPEWPRETTAQLVTQKYATDAWNAAL